MALIQKNDVRDLLSRVNLNHLLYFWAVAREGSVTAAAKSLGVAQPGVSEQIRTLETRLGATLFERGSRGVRLTREGRIAQRYAEEIVGVCATLVSTLPLRDEAEQPPMIVGVTDAIPKVVVRDLLRPLIMDERIERVVCREWRVDQLLADLSLHRIDAIVSDIPLPGESSVPIVQTVVAKSAVVMCCAPQLVRRAKRGFPQSLADLPLLLPADGTSLRASVEQWLALHRLRPRIAAEADDRAVLHHFAEIGLGVVPVAKSTLPDVRRQFGLQFVGELRTVIEQYYLITMERQVEHPGVRVIRESIASAEAGRRRTGRLRAQR